jgi:hypothetical protein
MKARKARAVAVEPLLEQGRAEKA